MSEKKSLFGFLKRWGSGTDLKNEEQNETNHFEYARSQTLEKSPLKSDTVITQQMELFCVDLLSQLLKKSQFFNFYSLPFTGAITPLYNFLQVDTFSIISDIVLSFVLFNFIYFFI